MQTQSKWFLAALLASSLFMANAEDEHHPADASANASANAPAGAATASTPSEPSMSKAMSDQMQKMQAAHDKAAAAKTPDERHAAMQESMKTMKESMAMMSQQHDVGGCMNMGSKKGMSGSEDGMGHGMMGMMMKMMDQQSSMMGMPMKQ
jgi:hypothetical protein